uniref:Uncharacterized protein n=1 Tax=Oryza glumipatula TaxID=40148 RepID=A0A0E0B0P1_9ORYZ
MCMPEERSRSNHPPFYTRLHFFPLLFLPLQMPTQTPPKLQLIKSSINYYLPIRKKRKKSGRNRPWRKKKEFL